MYGECHGVKHSIMPSSGLALLVTHASHARDLERSRLQSQSHTEYLVLSRPRAYLHQHFDAHGKSAKGLDDVKGVLIGTPQEAEAQAGPCTVAPARKANRMSGISSTPLCLWDWKDTAWKERFNKPYTMKCMKATELCL